MSKKTLYLVTVLVAAALGFALAMCGCVDGKAIEACGKACGSVGVKFVNEEMCQCNPRQEAVCK